jgi:hypothetical protein
MEDVSVVKFGQYCNQNFPVCVIKFITQDNGCRMLVTALQFYRGYVSVLPGTDFITRREAS